MNINDLLDYAKSINVKPSNKVINSAITLDEVSKEKYDGTFKSFYEAVKNNVIKILTLDGNLIGIDYDAKAKTIEEDNKECWAFTQAYKNKPVEYYAYAASLLVTANLTPDKIEEYNNELFLYLADKGQIINGYGDIIIDIDKEDLDEMLYKEDIIETLDSYLQAYKDSLEEDSDYDDCDDEDYYEEYDEDDYDDDTNFFDEDDDEDGEECDCENCSDEECECKKELPEVTYILKQKLPDNIDDNAIKTYLRNKYNHYLAKDCELYWKEDVEGIIVQNIKWGRKK